MKKVISVLLSLCIALSAISAGMVFAYADTESGTDIPGTDVKWSYDSETHELTIKGTGAIPDYICREGDSGQMQYDYPWKELGYTSVIFEEGITAIGNYAFCYSIALENVRIPETVTVLGKGIFLNCTTLKTVEISSPASISESMFAGCTKLEQVNFIKTGDTIGENAFYGCNALKEITLPNGVKTIEEEAFSTCPGLEAVRLPDSLKTVGKYAFYSCENLKTLELGNGVEKIDTDAFSYCRMLDNVVIPESVKTISQSAFNSCASLKSLTLPDDLAAQIGENAFALCTELVSVKIGPKVETIGTRAFGYGKKGAKVAGFTITGYENTAAQNYAQANGFSFVSLGNYLDGECGENAKWSFDEANGTLAISGSGAMNDFSAEQLPAYSRFAGKIKNIVIGEEITKLGAYAFYNMSVDSMTIPENIAEIGEKAVGNFEDGRVVEGFKIKGFRDTAAQTYAETNNIGFIDIRPLPTTGSCGENVVWSYDETSKTLTLSGMGATYDYSEDKLPDYAVYGFDIENVTVGEGITRIGDLALVLGCDPSVFDFSADVAELGEKAFGFVRREGEDGFTVVAGTDITVNGYKNTPVKAYCEQNGFEFVALDAPEVTPESVIEKEFSAKVDATNGIIYLYQLETGKDAFAAKLAEAGYSDVTISNDTLTTGATVEITVGEEKTSYIVIVPGDINGNGVVNSSDALDALNHAVEYKVLTGNEFAAADIDSSGVVNSSDALAMLRIAVGQIELTSFLNK